MVAYTQKRYHQHPLHETGGTAMKLEKNKKAGGEKQIICQVGHTTQENGQAETSSQTAGMLQQSDFFQIASKNLHFSCLKEKSVFSILSGGHNFVTGRNWIRATKSNIYLLVNSGH